MSTLRAILEIQGCLDTAVLVTQDPRVMEVADAFLPGTSTNSQWYQEIEAFMLPRGTDGRSEPRTKADPVQAMAELAADNRRPTAPEASRLIYALGAVIHLTQTVPMDPMPFEDPVGRGRARQHLAEVFALTGGHAPAPAGVLYADRLDQIVNFFANEFNGWQDWYAITEQLVGFGVLTADAASIPLCNAAVITYKG